MATVVIPLPHAFHPISAVHKADAFNLSHRQLSMPIPKISAPILPSATLPPLAPELWSAIFSHYLGDPQKDSVINYERRLLLLTSVCGHWRAVAVNTSIFWNHIEYAPPSSFHTDQFAKHSERIRTWLARSRGCLLSVSLRLRGSQGSSHDQVLREILGRSRRWESLHVQADSIRTAVKTLSSIVGLSELRSVKADVPFLGDDEDSAAFISLFKDTPSLSSFHLSKIDSSHLPVLTVLPLSQLKSVSLSTLYSPADVFLVLDGLRNVEELNISLDIGPARASTSNTPSLPITHPTIRRLSIEVAVRGDPLIISHLQRQVSTMLDNIDLPSLKQVSFTSAESHLPNRESLISFLQRHRSGLHTFEYVDKRSQIIKPWYGRAEGLDSAREFLRFEELKGWKYVERSETGFVLETERV